MKKILSVFVAAIILCAPLAYAQSADASAQPKKEGLIEELLHNFFHHSEKGK